MNNIFDTDPNLTGECDTDLEDYELYNYRNESEIRAIRPVAYGERVIATFPNADLASQAWAMMMEALTFHMYFEASDGSMVRSADVKYPTTEGNMK